MFLYEETDSLWRVPTGARYYFENAKSYISYSPYKHTRLKSACFAYIIWWKQSSGACNSFFIMVSDLNKTDYRVLWMVSWQDPISLNGNGFLMMGLEDLPSSWRLQCASELSAGVTRVSFYWDGRRKYRWKEILLENKIRMTSSNGKIFRVTGHLCGEFTGFRWIPYTKASGTEIWCFLWSASE